MQVHGQAVSHECKPKKVHKLALVTTTVGTAEPHRVVKDTIDAFNIASAPIHTLEVRLVSIGQRNN